MAHPPCRCAMHCPAHAGQARAMAHPPCRCAMHCPAYAGQARAMASSITAGVQCTVQPMHATTTTTSAEACGERSLLVYARLTHLTATTREVEWQAQGRRVLKCVLKHVRAAHSKQNPTHSSALLSKPMHTLWTRTYVPVIHSKMTLRTTHHDDDSCGAQARLRLLQRIKVHQHLRTAAHACSSSLRLGPCCRAHAVANRRRPCCRAGPCWMHVQLCLGTGHAVVQGHAGCTCSCARAQAMLSRRAMLGARAALLGHGPCCPAGPCWGARAAAPVRCATEEASRRGIAEASALAHKVSPHDFRPCVI